MADLTVHDLEEEIVQRLQEEAQRAGISGEEAHRRLLRRTLLGAVTERPANLKEFLLTMPDFPDEYEPLFDRVPEAPPHHREVEF